MDLIRAVDDVVAESRSGASVLLDVLKSEGVTYVFGNPGTTELPLMEALLDQPDVSYVLGLQEVAVVSMADGYAQASGRPGFVNLHTAGGLGHAMGALLNAHASRTPLVVTAGQQDTRHSVNDPLLQGDLVAIAKPAMKWAQEIVHADQIPVLVRRAFHDCSAAPAGPVFLSLPLDIMAERTSVSIGEVSTIDRAAVAGAVEQLCDELSSVEADRLAIIVGDEVAAGSDGWSVVALAETLGATVFGSSWPARMPFPTSHPLFAGDLPSTASEIRSRLDGFDVILILGDHSTTVIPYSDGPALPPGAKLLQLSADGSTLGRSYSTALSCVGDIGATVRAMLPLVQARLGGREATVSTARDKARQAKMIRHAEFDARVKAATLFPVTQPITAATEVIKAIGHHIAVIDEAPATMGHVRAAIEFSLPRRYAFNRGGALGWGMPAAVGTCLGLDRSPVISLVGDGSAMYAPQALWTAAHERLPVTFVVMNNREYGILKASMRRQGDYVAANAGRFLAMDIASPPIDFLALAGSMGVPARRIERACDIAAAVEDAVASGGPNLIEIPIAAG